MSSLLMIEDVSSCIKGFELGLWREGEGRGEGGERGGFNAEAQRTQRG